MEALQQSVVQVSSDSCSLADARLHRHLKFMMQLPDSALVGRPQQYQKQKRAERAKPVRLVVRW